MNSSAPNSGLPARAAVFTGQFDRVWLGLDLLARGEIEYLFISGVNGGAGILEDRFATQFALEDDLLQAFFDGKIELGALANTTLQNATETKCWLGRTGQSKQILLITSKRHMPRASVALEQAIPSQRIWRMSIPNSTEKRESTRSMLEEYTKYLATLMITHLPTGIGRALGDKLGQPPPIDCD